MIRRKFAKPFDETIMQVYVFHGLFLKRKAAFSAYSSFFNDPGSTTGVGLLIMKSIHPEPCEEATIPAITEKMDSSVASSGSLPLPVSIYLERVVGMTILQ